MKPELSKQASEMLRKASALIRDVAKETANFEKIAAEEPKPVVDLSKLKGLLNGKR